MFVFSPLLLLCLVVIIGARQPDVDINRVQLLPKEDTQLIYPYKYPSQKYQEANRLRYNDYDDHSSGLGGPQPAVHHVHDAAETADQETPADQHKPREDPRLFYQSDAYLKKVNRQNVNLEVASTYPGREVVRAGDEREYPPLSIRMSSGDLTQYPYKGFDVCVKCPQDRTLIAKAGSNRVYLKHPRLLTCSGQRAPNNVRFVHMYGPSFDSLIQEGSHMIVGRIIQEGKSLRLCKMQVHVVTQGCPTPPYLSVSCEDLDEQKHCNFTCNDPTSELYGASALICGDDLKWKGNLPFCKARTWCEPQAPPAHGHLSCQGETIANRSALVEGSKCRVWCARGWHWNSRAVAVCRRGMWTHALTCQPKRRFAKWKS